MAVFAHATIGWLDDPDPTLSEHLAATWFELKMLLVNQEGMKPGEDADHRAS